MSAEETALIRAIRDTPDDDLPRLALADWLDEHDLPERAEFLRAQVELARLPHDDPRRPALEDREHELLAENEEHWLGDLAAADGLHEWEFERGFLTEIAATPFCLSEHGPAVFATNPVRRWHVMSSDLDMSQDLIAAGRSNWIRRVESLDLTGWYESIGEMERFLTRSDLEHLRELDVTGRFGLDDLPDILGRAAFRESLKALRCGGRYAGEAGRLDAFDLARTLEPTRLAELSAPGTLLTAQDVRTILVSPCGRELTDLDVRDNGIEPDGWDAFRTSKCRLRALDLSGTPLGAISLESLLGCASLSDLRVLEMERCGSAVANIAALARSRFWTQAEELRIGSGTVPAHALDPLFESEGPTTLRTLDVSNNYLRDDGLARLCASPWARGLSWLSVARNYLTDDGLKAFAASARFPNLRSLHLSYNSPESLEEDGDGALPQEVLGDNGLIALAGSSALPNLRVLAVSGTLATHAAVEALLNGPHWTLSGLGLSGCQLGREVARVLADSPRLSRLTWLDLSGNQRLGGDALMPLAESPHLCRLTELDIRGVFPDDDVRDALRQRLGRRLSV
ncbi:MAG TPA: TIGR02996 domain-containing protein [Gemmataceae bacterium]|nr:TIGR02996 domain-containing protein [Gemmataceae bacterium]